MNVLRKLLELIALYLHGALECGQLVRLLLLILVRQRELFKHLKALDPTLALLKDLQAFINAFIHLVSRILGVISRPEGFDLVSPYKK